MRKYFSKGQGMLEYILLFAAVIAVLLVVLAPRRGFVATAIDSALDTSVNAIEKMAQNTTY